MDISEEDVNVPKQLFSRIIINNKDILSLFYTLKYLLMC